MLGFWSDSWVWWGARDPTLHASLSDTLPPNSVVTGYTIEGHTSYLRASVYRNRSCHWMRWTFLIFLHLFTETVHAFEGGHFLSSCICLPKLVIRTFLIFAHLFAEIAPIRLTPSYILKYSWCCSSARVLCCEPGPCIPNEGFPSVYLMIVKYSCLLTLFTSNHSLDGLAISLHLTVMARIFSFCAWNLKTTFFGGVCGSYSICRDYIVFWSSDKYLI